MDPIIYFTICKCCADRGNPLPTLPSVRKVAEILADAKKILKAKNGKKS